MNIQRTIDNFIQEHSGFQEHRDYLGMSQLNKCPRVLYFEFKVGVVADSSSHRMAYAGYEQESNILNMLEIAGVAKRVQRELVAPFDSHLRGHIDAETLKGDLLEIKSVSTARFKKVVEDNRPLFSHAIQVQMYMKYGNYKRAFIVYRNRETYMHEVFEVQADSRMQERYEEKAKMVLKAIDEEMAPECECGKCKS